MNWIRKKFAVFETRPARRLLIVSAVLTLVIALIALMGTFITSAANEIVLLRSYVTSLPSLVEERLKELDHIGETYRDDYEASGDIARTLYDEYEDLDLQRRLEFARRHTDAINVTLLDDEGNFVASATGEGPSPAVVAAFDALDSDETHVFDPNTSGTNDDTMTDEDGYVPEKDSMPIVCDGRTKDGHIIMVELEYGSLGQLLNDMFTWDSVFERAMIGIDGYGFIKAEDGLHGYPLEGLDDAQAQRLEREAGAAFGKLEHGLDRLTFDDGTKTSFAIVNFLGVPHLAASMPTDELGYTYMIAAPISSFAGFMVVCDIAIISLVIVGYILFSCYATESFRKEPIEATEKRLRAKEARRRTMPGIALMLAVTGTLMSMLIILEGLSNTARTTIDQQSTIAKEVAYLSGRKSVVDKEYTDRYRSRATALARMLTDNPNLRTRGHLKALNDVCRSEHLMLFDRDGNEICDSSGFTGVSVDDEKSGGRPEWRPVLQGYIQVETPTARNPVTGQYERTIATRLTDAEGLPDGFLLMYVNDDEHVKQIRDANLEGAVNSFTPHGDQMAAVVDNETGLFLAHTDPDMIGVAAGDYLDPSIIGHNFSGFSTYTGKTSDVYVSGVSDGGKTTLVITDSQGSEETALISCAMITVILLLILIFFYPAAASLCDEYVRERPAKKKPSEANHPMMVFYHGYVTYLAVLALVSYLGYVFGFWRAFGAVYNGDWTPGIHLFSFWSALFSFAVLSCITSGLHRVIAYIDEQSSTRTKTYARLVDSLVTYVLTITMLVVILTLLGVDTATIIGSVSIISIAIGMGTQDLVKDIVAGLFLIFEGTISVGDLVEIGGWHGRVTDMGIRTTEITNDRNDVKILTNSRIGDVVNMSKVKTACAEEFVLPRTVDVDELSDLVDSYIETIAGDIPEIGESLKMADITSITDDSYTVRLTYLVNEVDRESATIRLRNAMLLLLENQKEPKGD